MGNVGKVVRLRGLLDWRNWFWKFDLSKLFQINLQVRLRDGDPDKRDPPAFDKRENGPCNSGKNIQHCCGRLIGASKFGKWSAFIPVH